MNPHAQSHVHTKGQPFVVLKILALALALAMQGVPTTWAATFNVDRTDDDATATACVDATPNDCSLRGAIIEANALAGADTINLPAGTYTLTIPGTFEDASATGDLDITDDLTISGAGAATTIIDADAIDRVFHVRGANLPNAMFLGLTISHGMASGSGGGGGIRNTTGTVELRNSTVSHNEALFSGGGIFNSNVLTLIHSTVSDNEAGESGGGIRNMQGGTVTLIHSTVSGNTTNDDGGGIRNNGGMVTLIDSTVSGNTAADHPTGLSNHGGGIFNNNGGTLTLSNCTVSGNTANDDGGGIRNTGNGLVELFNCTITANTAGDMGGGIRNVVGTVNFQNTIIAGNVAGTSGPDCSGALSSNGDNLVGVGTGCPSSAMGDQTVLPADVFTTMLGTLQDNGGPTSTHALLAGSPAIDAGNPAGCTDDTDAI